MFIFLLLLCIGLNLATEPDLITFDFTLGNGEIQMQFTDLVASETFDVAKIALQSVQNISAPGANQIQYFFNTTFEGVLLGNQGNTSNLTFHMSEDDYAEFILTNTFLTSENNTYLVINADAVLNPDLNETNIVYDEENAVKARYFFGDTVPPYLVSCGLDMDQGLLNMTFSEPVNVADVTTVGIAFQSQSNSNTRPPAVYVKASTTDLGSLISYSSFQRELIFSLSSTDLNNIKGELSLCNFAQDCYLSMYEPFITDLSGNNISDVQFNIFVGKQVSTYIPDVTPPALVSWYLDLNIGGIVLTFSEIIEIRSFNYSALVLQTDAVRTDSTRTVVRVSNPLNAGDLFDADLNTVSFNVILNYEQLNLINKDTAFQSVSTSYLVMDDAACQDLAFTPNIFVGYSVGVNPIRFQPDTTLIQLLSFNFNMSSRIFTLQFSKVVNETSVSLNQMTVQSKRSISSSGTLQMILSNTFATVLPYNSSDVYLNIQLTDAGFTFMRNLVNLGVSASTTFITVSGKFIKDRSVSKNAILPVEAGLALIITTYTADYVAPTLLAWGFDASNDLMNLTFSEPIDISTFNVNSMSLQSDASVINATVSVAISSLSTVTNYGSGLVIVHLARNDVNNIKSQSGLCSSIDLCYLIYTSSLASTFPSFDPDFVQVSVVPSENFGVPPSSFIVDTTPPVLQSFGIDINVGRLYLNFNEPVVNDEMNSAGITLYGDSLGTISYQLSEFSYSSGGVNNSIVVTMSQFDFLHMKSTANLATSVSNVFLYLAADTVSDVAGNANSESKKDSNTLNYLRPYYIIEDTTSPSVVGILYDRSNDLIYVKFNDAVITNTVQSVHLLLLSANGNDLALSNARYLSTGYSATLIYNVVELTELMTSISIGVDQDNTNLFVDKFSAVTDTSLNSLFAIDASHAVREGNTILNFHLDLTQKILTLEMAFPLNVTTILMPYLRLYMSSTGYSVTLSNYLTFTISDGIFVSIYLVTADYYSILQSLSIASSSDVVLIVDYRSITDGNNEFLSSSSVVPCARFVADKNLPQLLSFTMDLNSGFMTLFFSKPVLYASMDITRLAVVSGTTNSAEIINFFQSVIVVSGGQTSSTEVRLNINYGTFPRDIDLVLLSSAGRSIGTTNIIAYKGFISDTAVPLNYLAEFGVSSAVACTSLIMRSSIPVLSSFDVDMNLRTIILNFNIGMNRTTNKIRQYIVVSDPTVSNSASFTLTTNSQTVFPPGQYANYGSTVVLQLGSDDVDSILSQAPSLYTSASNTYLATTTANSIIDISPLLNSFSNILFRFAIPVRNFIPDTTPPSLVSFNVNMLTGVLSLIFDEPVDCSTANLGNVRLQNGEFVGTGVNQMLLTSSSRTNCPTRFARIVDIILGSDDLPKLQSFVGLFKGQSSSYVRPLVESFSDAFGNFIIEVIDGSAVACGVYTQDTSAPKLIAFTATAQHILVLRFSKPVSLSSLFMPGFLFQDDFPVPQAQYPLATSILFGSSSNQRVLEINLINDYTTITVASQSVFLIQNRTYLGLLSTALTDTFGNAVQAVGASEALGLGPIILSFALDMNASTITLHFSEVVAEGFTSVGLSFQSTASSSAVSVDLTGVSVFSYTDSTSLTLTGALSASDANRMKYLGIGTNSSTSFMTASFGVTYSLSAITIIPFLKSVRILNTSALAVASFTGDFIKPRGVSFGLDLNAGLLELFFSEPIVISTLKINKVTLVPSLGGGSITLTAANDMVEGSDISSVLITLTDTDLNAIKVLNTINPIDSVIYAANFVRDLAGNFIGSVSNVLVVPIVYFVPDTTPATLLYSSLNLNTKILRFTFDERIDLNSLAPENVTFYSSSSSLSAVLNLSRYTLVSEDPTNPSEVVLDMSVLRLDAFTLDDNVNVATSLADTYLSVDGLYDLSGNLFSTTIFQVSEFIANTRPPLLQSFELLLSSGIYSMTLYFNENVDLTTFTCADLILADNTPYSSASVSVGLSGMCSLVTSGSNSRVVEVTVASSVFTDNPTLFTSPGAGSISTYLGTVDSPVTEDLSGLLLVPVGNSSSPLIPVGPRVINYILNMNVGALTFVFSQSVDRSGTFNSDMIGLKSLVSSQSEYLSAGYSLDGLFSDSNTVDEFGVITFTYDDITNLKLLDIPLQASVILLLDYGAIFDSDGYSVNEVIVSDAMHAYSFLPDIIAPRVTHVTLDMGLAQIQFLFDEPIRSESFDPRFITVQAGASIDTSSYRQLTGGTFEYSVLSLNLTLARADSVAIKLTSGLADTALTSYLSYEFGTFVDFSGNSIIAVLGIAAQLFDSYITDTVGPNLISFDLNMDTGAVELYFDEPVNSTGFNASALTLQFRYSSPPTEQYRITAASTVPTESEKIAIVLSSYDVFHIKGVNNLCRNEQSSYLISDTYLIQDLSGNYLQTVSNGAAVPVLAYVADIHPPHLLSYSVNYNNFSLQLEFDELLILSTVTIPSVSFQAFQNFSGNSYAISPFSTFLNPDNDLFGSSINVVISAFDMNNLKFRFPLASSLTTTWLTMASTFATDTFGNQIVSVSPTFAMGPSSFTLDSVSPTLTTFSIDMNQGLVVLVFSEAILPSSFSRALSIWVVQSAAAVRFGSAVTFQGSQITFGTGADSTTVSILLSKSSLFSMYYNSIGATQKRVFLSYGVNPVSDVTGNYLLPLFDGSVAGNNPRRPDVYTPDTTRPSLDRWFIDGGTDDIHFLFSEPIVLVNISAFVFSFGSVTFRVNGTFEYLELNSHIIISPETVCTQFTAGSCLNSSAWEGYLDGIGVAQSFSSLQLSYDSSGAKDFAGVPNLLFPISLQVVGGPDCSQCPPFQYVSEPCTSSTDRVCSSCSSCAEGFFPTKSCSASSDVVCQACTVCPFGQYASTECSSTSLNQNTVCSACSVCGDLQFEASPCGLGVNTVCDSCQQCTFSNENARSVCLSQKYLWWYLENCCFDGNGNTVPCSQLDLSNMLITAADGMMQWPPQN